ncbi:MAG TPA: flagellar hook-basal body complex protein FliE [Chloroflexota bacterium]|nr:flagellar hook-basal body complex protein FliE [Chloroflexota bacterium]
MPLLPISPLSPALPLMPPEGSTDVGLGPIPNVPDGIPGIGGIGSVELPGLGVITGPANGGSLTSLPLAPVVTAPASTPAANGLPSIAPLPEVTPFAGAPQPTSTPVPVPLPSAGPTALPNSTLAPAPTATPTTAAGNGQAPLPLEQPGQGSPYSTQPITTTTIPNPIQTPFQPPATAAVPVKQNAAAADFGQYLQQAATNYNDVQAQANDLIQRLATGDKVDIHDVALAVQKASITNQLAIQVRNRLVEAYQQVMAMQM